MDVGEQVAAGVADRRTGAPTVQEVHSELALEVADALAEGRLRQVQLPVAARRNEPQRATAAKYSSCSVRNV